MSDDEILNYDPSCYEKPVMKVQPVVIIRPDGTRTRILFPFDDLEGKTEQEKAFIVLQTDHVYRGVDKLLLAGRNPLDSAKQAAFVNGLVSHFSWQVAVVIAGNALNVYLRRAATEEVVDRRGGLDLEGKVRTTQTVADRIYRDLQDVFQNNQEAANDVEKWFLSSVLAGGILAVMKAHNYEPVGNFEDLVRKECRSRAQNFAETTERMAEEYGAHLLENRIRPVQMPIEKLRDYIQNGPYRHFSPSEIINFIKNLQRVRPEDLVFRENERGGVDFSVKSRGGIEGLLEPPKPGPRPDLEKKRQQKEFAEKVNKQRTQDIARYLSEFAKDHIHSNWIKQLEQDGHYPYLCKGYESVIREAEQVLYKYQINTALSKSTVDHATSALGVAQIIIAVEMDLRNSDGTLLSINTLNEWYRKGGGHRWSKKPKR